MADPLADGGYPVLYEAANSASLAGQSHFMRALRLRLLGLLIATIGSAAFLTAQLPELAGWAALIGFVSALGAELYTAVAKPDRRWYQGRAAAESVKTLAWRYAVGGEKFEIGMANVDDAFLEEIRSILKDLKDVDLTAPTSTTDQITDKLREMRASPFEDRRSAFAEGRIEDQREWYSRKAAWNATRLHRWTIAVITAEALGVIGGALTMAYSLTLDLLGVLAAIAATITAWVQAKQHGNLTTAYAITSQELASIRSATMSVPEKKWAKFVGESEEAISREHTLWRASRGV